MRGKKVISFFVAVIMLAGTMITGAYTAESVYGKENEVQQDELIKFLKSDEQLTVQSEKEIYDMAYVLLGKTDDKEINIHLGKAVSMYNFEENTEIQVYPVLDENNNCILLAQVPEDGNVSICNDLEWYDNIKKSVNDAGEYILYINSGVIYAESTDDKIELEDTKYGTKMDSGNADSSYEEKVEEVFENTDSEFVVYGDDIYGTEEPDDYDVNDDEGIDDEENEDEETYGIKADRCDIKKFIKQGNYNLCWAASVATIVDYKKNRNISAKTVANAMKVGYNTGAGIATVEKALKYYGLNYVGKNKRITWSGLKHRISVNDRPFCIGLRSKELGGHMVTAFGYAQVSPTTSRMMECWDPNGDIRIFKYGNEVSLYGYTFTWESTVY